MKEPAYDLNFDAGDLESEISTAYLNLLPGPYQGAFHGPHGEQVDRKLIGLYLRIFEKILTAQNPAQGADPRSMGELLDVLPDILYPGFYFLASDSNDVEEAVPDFFFDIPERGAEPGSETNTAAQPADIFASYLRVRENFPGWLEELLDWIAGWVGLVLHRNWSIQKKRTVIARILPLYRKRGTREGLEALLKLFFDRRIKIIDDVPGPAFRIGGKTARLGSTKSRSGVPRPLGGFPEYYFIAAVALKVTDLPRVHRLVESIRVVIEREKPLHVNYNLAVRWPAGAPGRFYLGRSRVGVDSRL